MYKVIPSHYRIHLSPDYSDFSCRGNVTIEAEALEPTNIIILNAREMIFESAKVYFNDSEIDVEFETEADKEEIHLKLKQEISGPLSMVFKFTSYIKEDMQGLYRCYYKEEGEKKIMITSQFEAKEARKTFPCFDTPALKATFDLTLEIPKGLTAVFCTDVREETDEINGKRIISFELTPVMTTYALYIGIADFKMITKWDNDLIVRFISPVDNLEFGSWTLDAMIDVIRYMERETGVAYPLSKLDYISVPGFPYLAMENYGAIAARDVVATLNPQESSPGLQIHNWATAYHEVVHMWLGNLVTIKSWDDVWLNESFTSLMHFIMLEEFKPEFLFSRILNEVSQHIPMKIDGLNSVYPIFRPGSEQFINAVNVPIIYHKGSLVLQMFHDYWGHRTFMDGISEVMRSLAFKSTDNKEYLRLFSKGSGQDTEKLIMPWILKPGIPEISVKRIDNVYRLTQRRFFYIDKEEEGTWPIPLSLVHFNAEGEYIEERIMFNTESIDIPVKVDYPILKCNHSRNYDRRITSTSVMIIFIDSQT